MKAGIEVYNAAGVCTFDGTFRPVQIVGEITAGQPSVELKDAAARGAVVLVLNEQREKISLWDFEKASQPGLLFKGDEFKPPTGGIKIEGVILADGIL